MKLKLQPERPVNWRKVWRVMHDLHYKQLSLRDATDLARAAGHPDAAALAIRTAIHGYTLSRE